MTRIATGLSLLVTVTLLATVFAFAEGGSSEAAADLVARAPIFISSDSEFTTANGVVSGNGTIGNPYIIEGWEINASSSDAIRIQDTTSYFVVRDVHVFDGRYFVDDFDANDGIALENVENARIENVTAERCRYGVWVLSSSSAVVTGCRASLNNFSGIGFSGSEHVSASDNVVNDNFVSELFMGFCMNSTINDNTVRDSGVWSFRHEGIDVWRSENVSIVGNYLEGNGNSVFLETSSNCTVWSNTIVNDTGHALYVYYSGNSTFFLNDIYTASHSVAVQESTNNTFYHNNFRSGLIAYGAAPNKFDNGYPFGGNYWEWNAVTDSYRGSGQDIEGPDGIDDDPYDIGWGFIDQYPLTMAYHSIIAIDGNYEFTAQNGVVGGDGTSGNPYLIAGWLIDADLAVGGAAGITISHADAHFVVKSVVIRSGGSLHPGVCLSDVSNGSITESVLIDNREGITLDSTDNMTITDNIVVRNALVGIYISRSDGVDVEANQISNATYGLYLQNCTDSELYENLISAGNSSIAVDHSDEIFVTKNSVSNSSYGVRLTSSPNCTVNQNVVSNNGCGIYINKSESVKLSDNVFEGNGVDIVTDEIATDGETPWLWIILIAIIVCVVVSLVAVAVWKRGKKPTPPGTA